MSAPAPSTPACPYAFRQAGTSAVWVILGGSRFALRDGAEAARHGVVDLRGYPTGQVHELNAGDGALLLPVLVP